MFDRRSWLGPQPWPVAIMTGFFMLPLMMLYHAFAGQQVWWMPVLAAGFMGFLSACIAEFIYYKILKRSR